ncbi:MAG: hydrogenase maturation nickel metallochaperone HypA [Opitutaceae bacterium]|nr:hydrogenase maturation nickel metallochaperone HypA [Opitutaceae bacterium]
MASTLDAVGRAAAAHRAHRVARIVLRIGDLSGVEPDALRFAFEALAPRTRAAGAELAIERVPARAHCRGCGADFAVGAGFIFRCPGCGDLSGDVIAGRELELRRIEFS